MCAHSQTNHDLNNMGELDLKYRAPIFLKIMCLTLKTNEKLCTKVDFTATCPFTSLLLNLF